MCEDMQNVELHKVLRGIEIFPLRYRRDGYSRQSAPSAILHHGDYRIARDLSCSARVRNQYEERDEAYEPVRTALCVLYRDRWQRPTRGMLRLWRAGWGLANTCLAFHDQPSDRSCPSSAMVAVYRRVSWPRAVDIGNSICHSARLHLGKQSDPVCSSRAREPDLRHACFASSTMVRA